MSDASPQPRPADDDTKRQMREFVQVMNETQDRLEKLTERVNELEDDVEKNTGLLTALRRQAKSIKSFVVGEHNDMAEVVDETPQWRRVKNAEDEIEDLRNQLAQQQNTIEELTAGTSGANQSTAWKTVLEEAKRLKNDPTDTEHDMPDGKVKLFKEDLARATGYSARHCQDLIEEFGDEKFGCKWEPYQPASDATRGQPLKKRLIIDLAAMGEA